MAIAGQTRVMYGVPSGVAWDPAGGAEVGSDWIEDGPLGQHRRELRRAGWALGNGGSGGNGDPSPAINDKFGVA